MNFLDGVLGFAAVIVLLVAYLFLMLLAAALVCGVIELCRWRPEWEDNDG
jgi:hypothetical protein